MGIDWIDDLLQKAEGIPGLSGFAHQLRFAYEVWREDPPDPQPVRDQHQALDNLHGKATQLSAAFNDSLLSLRNKWTGNVAAFYLGPEVTFAQIEHGAEPPEVGAGWQMWRRLGMVTSMLDYNSSAHQDAATKLAQIQSLHGQLDGQVTAAAVTMGALVVTTATPGLEEFDLIDGPAEAIEVADAVETAEELIKVAQAAKTVEQVADDVKLFWTVAGILSLGAIGSVAMIVLMAFNTGEETSTPTNSLPPTNTLVNTLSDEQITELAEKYGVSEDDIRAIIEKYPGLTLEQLEALLSKWQAIKAKYPNLVSQAGSEQQVLLLFVFLSLDPAHTKKNRQLGINQYTDVDQGILEAEICLDAFEQGFISTINDKLLMRKLKQQFGYDIGLITRDPNGDAEAIGQTIDPTTGKPVAQPWDVKGPSRDAGGNVNVDETLDNIEHELSQGENVIIDETTMTPEQAEELYGKLGSDADRVLWWKNGTVSNSPLP